jgi:hypothetical protein
MLDDPKPFRDAVTQAFGALSGYVHPSHEATRVGASNTLRAGSTQAWKVKA